MKLCTIDEHLLIVTYYRPWRRLFRRVYLLRCWQCDLDLADR